MFRGMYVPSEFACDETAAWAIVAAHPFALLVLADLESAHVPIVRRGDALIGHVAFGSSLARGIEAGASALAVFSGPHAFVSPRTYVSPRQVPTWNYVTTHVHGTLRAITDVDGAVEVLRTLSRTFDPSWDAEPMLGARASGLLRGIVAFEMSIERVVGKRKLGQNRVDADRIAAGHVLAQSTREEERSIGHAMLAIGDHARSR
jgi:transcriptional regulator